MEKYSGLQNLWDKANREDIEARFIMELKKILGLSLLALTMSAHAGFNGTTAASRANCINNESITWYYNHQFMWKTISTHQHVNGRNDPYWHHLIDTGWATTWRSAAVHWSESPDVGQYKWDVDGYHFYIDYANGKWPMAQTYARDCHLYDGWWDFN